MGSSVVSDVDTKDLTNNETKLKKVINPFLTDFFPYCLYIDCLPLTSYLALEKNYISYMLPFLSLSY